MSTVSSSSEPLEIPAGRPLPLIEAQVEARRTNALGHLRAAEYVALFDDAIMVLFERSGLTDGRLLHGTSSPFLMDLHATYLREVRAGDRIEVCAQLLDVDRRRARLILLMHETAGGALAGTCELLIVNMDLASRRPADWSEAQAACWQQIRAAHASLAPPAAAGRAIGPLARP